jgi:AraC-like DNA-binding protein
MPVTVRKTNFNDFEALQHMVQDGRSDLLQIGRGRMSGTLTHLAVDPKFNISTGTFSRGMRARGVLNGRRWTFAMLLETSGEATAQHHKVLAGDVAMIGPGEDRYVTFQDGTSYSAIFIEPLELETFLASHPGAQDVPTLRQPVSVMIADPATAAANVKQLSPLLSVLIDEGPTLPDEIIEFYKRNILELLTAPLRDGSHYHDSQPRSSAVLVRDVDRYIDEAGSRPIHISELCEHFHVHRRRLHRAFDEVLGVPPITFLRRKRLSDVHSALLLAGPAATVKKIAIEHGFLELGRFSAAYRRMFGELPSTTLRRRFANIAVWIAGYCGAALV